MKTSSTRQITNIMKSKRLNTQKSLKFQQDFIFIGSMVVQTLHPVAMELENEGFMS